MSRRSSDVKWYRLENLDEDNCIKMWYVNTSLQVNTSFIRIEHSKCPCQEVRLGSDSLSTVSNLLIDITRQTFIPIFSLMHKILWKCLLKLLLPPGRNQPTNKVVYVSSFRVTAHGLYIHCSTFTASTEPGDGKRVEENKVPFKEQVKGLLQSFLILKMAKVWLKV